MTKLDWEKELKHLYQPSIKAVTQVDVPENYLVIDGKGDPNTAKNYVAAIKALCSLVMAAMTLKFIKSKSTCK
jgi:hypothetical protein